MGDIKMIKRVYTEEEASQCDWLLSLLIADEKQYDENTPGPFVVKDYFKNVIKNPENILLAAFCDDRIIGYTYLTPIGEAKRSGYLIDGLYVERLYRNEGYGKSLLKEAIKILKTKDLDYIEIKVMSHNKIAKKLYHSLGFKDHSITMQQKLNKKTTKTKEK